MAAIIEYKRKLKQGDFGDLFQISFDEDPPEFAFDDVAVATFHAKSEDGLLKFSGSCILDSPTKTALYTTVSGSIEIVATYKFEFEFKDNAIAPTFTQTYPKDREITFDVVEQYD
jgi:hypothetical protein